MVIGGLPSLEAPLLEDPQHHGIVYAPANFPQFFFWRYSCGLLQAFA